MDLRHQPSHIVVTHVQKQEETIIVRRVAPVRSQHVAHLLEGRQVDYVDVDFLGDWWRLVRMRNDIVLGPRTTVHIQVTVQRQLFEQNV